MRALITGGAGFIGSHLAEAMLDGGHAVTVVDNLSTGSLDNIAHLAGREGFQFVRETVENAVTLTPLVERSDVVFHLAAAVGVMLIARRPVHTLETNIHGSEVMLALANTFGRKILIASTSEVYGKSDRVPFSEDDDVTLGSTRFSRWSYACSKMVDEFLALAYCEQYGLATIVCRLFNTTGPRQTGQYGMVVPRFVRWALTGQPIQIYGSGEQSRCFCNVADIVAAMMRLIECPEAVGQVINVGNDQSITINELADKIIEMTGSASPKQYLSYEQAYGLPFDDMLVRKADLSKIKRLIGFRARFSLDETLAQVIEYEQARLDGGLEG